MLITRTSTATTATKWAEALKACFFPPHASADYFDIPSLMYPTNIPLPILISEKEISSIITKSHTFQAAGNVGIPFFVFKRPRSLLFSFIQPFFWTCNDFSYDSSIICHFNIVLLSKPDKGNYWAPWSWHPITLLNILGKVLRGIMA